MKSDCGESYFHITHDLKTPLAALRGYLETWLLQQASSSETSYIEIALRNAKQLNELVDQLVELARLEGGIETLRLEPIAIAEFAQDVMSKFSLRAAEQGIDLEVTPQDTSLMISADIGKLERVLSNLIDNALRPHNYGRSDSYRTRVRLTNRICLSRYAIRAGDYSC